MKNKKYIFLFSALCLLGILSLAGCAQEKQTTAVTAENATFEALILEVSEGSLLVQPVEDAAESRSAGQIAVSTKGIGEEGSVEYLKTAQAGDTVSISYNGEIAESFPAQIAQVYAISLVERAPEQPALPETVYVADAAQYRGELLEQADGSWLVAQVPGRDYGYPSLTFIIDENTKTSAPWKDYTPGDYVEIYYGVAQGETAAAIGINKLGRADMVIYNGILKEKMEQEGRISLLLESMENPGQTAVFHISEETQLYFNWEDVQPGDAFSILYNGIMTRSLPPQANAKEISRYTTEQ